MDTMVRNQLHVLLVEDDEDDYLITCDLLKEACHEGVNIEWTDNYTDAVELIEQREFDVYLFDYFLGADSGLDLTRWVIANNRSSPVILLTGMDNREIDLEAMESGATDYLVKQELNPQLLERSIRYAIRHKMDESKLMELAHYDPLTGLANRTLFHQILQRTLNHSNRSGDYFALLTLDLDHFKNINDTLGHEAGDKLLQKATLIISSLCRDTDTVSRLGGDEFTIIATHLLSKESAAALAQKIIEAFEQPIRLGTQTVVVGVSIGISICPLDTKEYKELMRLSDLALYQAKSLGRNTYCFYDEELNKKAHEQTKLQIEIAKAVKKMDFQLHYQPIVDVSSGELRYVEALMRWNHPERGPISPSEFIPVMELNSTIVTVSEWVIDQACQQHLAWQEQGLPAIRIAVNISAKHFLSHTLISSIERTLNKYSLPTSCLILELTESVLMPKQQVLLKELRRTGLKISVDDFGTGYSSLSYLKRFDVNTLKIDREFVKDIPNDKDDEAITSAIIGLAQTLNLDIVAEGIETEQQRNYMIEKGCLLAQGFLFGYPMPPEDFVEWYEKTQRPMQDKNRGTALP